MTGDQLRAFEMPMEFRAFVERNWPVAKTPNPLRKESLSKFFEMVLDRFRPYAPEAGGKTPSTQLPNGGADLDEHDT